LQINPKLFCYISAVTRGVVTVNDSNSVLVVYTSYFQEVRAALLESRIVSIVGAKGCGKTFLAIVMYAIFHNARLDCLYLTVQSLNINSGYKYFNDFITNHAKYFENGSLEIIQNLLSDEKSFFRGVLQLILTFTAKKHLYLFVDLSVFNSTAPDAVLNLLELALQCLEGSIILSESSGARILIIKM